MLKKLLPYFYLVLSIIGVADSGYLTYAHFTNSSVVCPVTNSCNIVLSSPYSKVLGIPLSLIGFIFYIIILNISIFYIQKKSEILKKILILLTTAGFLASIYFVYLQAAVIKAFCIECLISAGTSLLLFTTSILSIILKKSKENKSQKDE